MPPKKDVKCFERTNKKGQRYTTCKDKKTGEQLRKTTKTTKSTPAKKPSPPKAKSPPKTGIEKRTGKTRAEINRMRASSVVKALPPELREKIAKKMELNVGDLMEKKGAKEWYEGKHMLIIDKFPARDNKTGYTLVVVKRDGNKDVNWRYDKTRNFNGEITKRNGMRLTLLEEQVFKGKKENGKYVVEKKRYYDPALNKTRFNDKNYHTHEITISPMKRIQSGYKPNPRYSSEKRLGNDFPEWTKGRRWYD
jgi:hypothetical protein